MSDNNKQKEPPKEEGVKDPKNQNIEENKELTVEEKLKETEEKLLRSLAEIENQRRRSKKKLKMHLNLDHLTLLKKIWQF